MVVLTPESYYIILMRTFQRTSNECTLYSSPLLVPSPTLYTGTRLISEHLKWIIVEHRFRKRSLKPVLQQLGDHFGTNPYSHHLLQLEDTIW